MSEYISREKIAAEARELSTHLLNEWDTMGVLALIDRQPAADVAPVVHAHWGRGSEDGRRKCSHCGMYEHERNYCGFCGAKMDESEGEE